MTASRTFPARQAVASENRAKILSVARAAFATPADDLSMAEIARRAGVGMATLYRNFPGRRELLEAVYADEVDVLCAPVGAHEAVDSGTALVAWLRRLWAFLPGKRLLVDELLTYTDRDDPAIAGNRARALAAGRPLLAAAQAAGQVRADLTVEQVFDLIVAIALIRRDSADVDPLLDVVLGGLRP